MELQADRTEIAPTGPPEVAEPLCAAHLRCAVRCAPPQEIAETVSPVVVNLMFCTAPSRDDSTGK